jgi:small subunit ribosomal protein S18
MALVNKKRNKKIRKVCDFCKKINPKEIEYKNVELLSKYILSTGKILPRRQTGVCAKHQRLLVLEIKKARQVALLPFSAN